MRNWLSAFRPASFRGFGFNVEMEEAAGGRRLAISPIAYSDSHVDEDLGGSPQMFRLMAYVAGDTADALASGFARALQRPGTGTLVLPMLGGMLARVVTWRLARELRRAGFVAFDIEFVAGGLSAPAFARVPAEPRLAAAMTKGAEILGSAVAWSLRSVAAGRGASHADAASAIGGLVLDLAVRSGLSPDHVATVSDRGQEIVRAAPEPLANAAAISSGIVLALADIGGYGEPELVAEMAATSLRTFEGTLPFETVCRAAVAGAFCQALVRRDYRARQDARAARDLISPAVDPVLSVMSASLDAESHGWLSQVAAIAAQDLSDTAASRSPVVRVESGISLPATAIAYQLYGDTDRADELARRNAVPTPAVMPVRIEAVST